MHAQGFQSKELADESVLKDYFNCFLVAPIASTIAAISCLPLIAQEKEREAQQDRSILLAPWTGLGGVPPWNLVRKRFLGAFEDGLLKQIVRFKRSPTRITIHPNTIYRWRAGDTLNRLVDFLCLRIQPESQPRGRHREG